MIFFIKKTIKIIFNIIFLVLFLTSCSIWQKKNLPQINCSDTTLINERKNLFPPLNKKEIAIRKKTKLDAILPLDQASIISEIIKAINATPLNAKFIPIDLRYYKEVYLTNIIFSSESAVNLNHYLLTSKYSQGYFTLFNFGSNDINIFPPKTFQAFKSFTINRPDLREAEIVINANNVRSLFGNLKFSSQHKFSIFSDNIFEPVRLDLREASDAQFNLNNQWIMPVYSIKNTQLKDSKISTVQMYYVDNKNSIINNKKFTKSNVSCYLSSSDMRFIKKN
jgi:hypothetical protein